MENNELAHYGVVGMKWGVRKEKYYEKKAKTSSGKKKEKYIDKLKKQKKENKKSKKAYRAKILSDPTKLYKHRNEFSKEEIDKAMSKFNREQKLRGYSRDKQGYNSSQNKLKKAITMATGAIVTVETLKRGKKLVDDFVFNRKYKQTSLF